MTIDPRRFTFAFYLLIKNSMSRLVRNISIFFQVLDVVRAAESLVSKSNSPVDVIVPPKSPGGTKDRSQNNHDCDEQAYFSTSKYKCKYFCYFYHL